MVCARVRLCNETHGSAQHGPISPCGIVGLQVNLSRQTIPHF